MTRSATWILTILLALSSAVTAQKPAESPETGTPVLPDIRLEPMFNGAEFPAPVQLLPVPGKDDTFVIVEQRGRLTEMKAGKDSMKRTLLDMRDKVRVKNSEEGLLSIVYPPDATKDPHLYLYYSASKPRRSVLSRMLIKEDGTIDKTTEKVILEVPQPYGNHNGGTVLFGPDGMLYLSLGDGGSANDPEKHGQNIGNLLATVIRIDVNVNDKPYVVPADNPFIDTEGACPEIWAYGLRNVWRMHFDAETGELWAGDVGQNAWEEIDIITRGGNYGWRFREGEHDFRMPDDAPGDLIDPVIEYPRNAGQSVTGGFVYRGKKIPDLVGGYLFADYMTGRVWAARLRPDDKPYVKRVLAGEPMAISSFGEGHDGELYVCGFKQPYARQGRIYRIVEAKAR